MTGFDYKSMPWSSWERQTDLSPMNPYFKISSISSKIVVNSGLDVKRGIPDLGCQVQTPRDTCR